MVRRAAESLFKMYTSFCFSIAPSVEVNLLSRLLVRGTNHNRSAPGISSQVLARNQPPTPRFAESFHVNPYKRLLLLTELQNGDPSAVTTNYDVVSVCPSEAERGKGANAAKDLRRNDSLQLAIFIRAE